MRIILPLVAALVAACVTPVLPPPSPEVNSLAQAEALLREACPTRLPVEVRLEPDLPGGLLGVTFRTGLGITILVECDQPFQVQLDTLIHEWAHASVWSVIGVSSHDDYWAVAYGHAYRAVHRERPRFVRGQMQEAASNETCWRQ